MKSQKAVDAWLNERVLLCDVCEIGIGPIEEYVTGTFGGRAVSPEEEVALLKAHPSCFIVCEPCLNKMPDATDLFLADGTEIELLPSTEAIIN